KSVKLPCNSAARAIHLLGCVSGWGFPISEKGTVTVLVRLHYADGQTEDHALKNGEHFADYAGRPDVPKSEFAFSLAGGQQLRSLAVVPQRAETSAAIEFVKGDEDVAAPVIMAVTVEKPDPKSENPAPVAKEPLTPSGQERLTLTGHEEMVWAAAFAPGG